MLQSLRSVSSFCNRILLWIGGFVLLGMMLLACANMFSRAIWTPIKGSYELIGFFGALVAAFSLGNTQENKGHIALTLLSGMLSRRVERGIDAFAALVCAALFGLIAWRTGVWAWSLVQTGELSETLRIIYYPFAFAVALGVLALALTLLCDFLSACIAVARPADPEVKRS